MRGSRVWGKVFQLQRHGYVKSKKLNAKVRQKCSEIEGTESWDKERRRL